MASGADHLSPDLLVAGGGVAGIAAALAAARRGLKVTLLEKEVSLGGTATLGLLSTICGLYRNGGSEAGAVLNSGISEEIVTALCTGMHATTPLKVGKVFVLPYATTDLAQLLTELCSRERNLTLCCSTSAVAVMADGGRVRQVVARQGGREIVFHPRTVVDASGDGEVAALAGAEFYLSPSGKRQMAGIMAIVDNVGQDDSLGIRVSLQIARGVEAAEIPSVLRYTTFSRGVEDGEGTLKINLMDGSRLTAAQIRELATELLSYLARELPAFGKAVIRTTPERIFHREGRRIRGNYALSARDILTCRKFSDGEVRAAWPMELWQPRKGASYRYPLDGDYYEIPLRCLTVRGFSNLFVAGRCISVSHEALASTRVIGCCIPLGEQAGLAAARLCGEQLI